MSKYYTWTYLIILMTRPFQDRTVRMTSVLIVYYCQIETKILMKFK